MIYLLYTPETQLSHTPLVLHSSIEQLNQLAYNKHVLHQQTVIFNAFCMRVKALNFQRGSQDLVFSYIKQLLGLVTDSGFW